jgi:hypothetical protein
MPQIVEIDLRRHQIEVWNQTARFGVLLAHRRFGKTVLAVAMMVKAALLCPHRRPQVHYYCPTYGQAKKVAWQYLKDATEAFRGTTYNESELKAVLPGGALLQLGSADNPHASRGIYSDFVVLDEPAQMPPSMWTEVLRPALSDRNGGGLFIGTPHGRHGLFYDAWCDADGDASWWRACYKASDTGIIPESELHSAQRAMSVAEYQQEYECSWDAAIKGAYWAAEMQKADSAGRITQVIHRPALPVHISMDLGINDATACWFFQVDGDAVHVIDYAEYTNMGLPDIVRDWRARPYLYGKVIMPHDGAQRSLSTGQTRQETMRQLGCDAIICKKHDVIDGIERVRSDLSRMRFDKTRCKDGIEALRQYRSDWEEQKGVLRLRPLHDWTSHGADAMRYLCMAGTEALAGGWGELDYTRQDKHRCA